MRLRATKLNAIGNARRGMAWTPAQLGAALALWLDAADSGTITLNGSTVAQWNDKSGNGRHVSQATAGNQPIYTLNGLNGLPVLTFDQDRLRTSATLAQISSSTSYSAMLLGAATSASTTDVWGNSNNQFWSDSSYSRGRSVFVTSGSSVGAFNWSNNGQQSTIQSYTFNQNSLIYSAIEAGSLQLRLNGGNQTSSSVGATDPTGMNSVLEIGGGSGNTALRGRIAEFVWTSSALSTADRQRLEGYLAWKWGTVASLPAGHPFRNQPPTV